MNMWPKTLGLMVLAGAAATAAYLTRPTAPAIALLSDLGTPLAPALTDPLAVRTLEVISFDPESARARAFKVTWDGKRWVVPSASNYPADADRQMAQAASALAGVLRERVVSDSAEDHERLGVTAPDDAQAAVRKGHGVRVTMRGEGDALLADVIVGGSADDREENPFRVPRPQRYVRDLMPGAPVNRVYVATLAGGFSTRLVDWVETDLLKQPAADVVEIMADRYSVDEQTGQLIDPQRITLSREPYDPFDPNKLRPWGLKIDEGTGSARGPGPGELVNHVRAEDLAGTLASLRIVGVRPKPPTLAAALGSSDNAIRLSANDRLSLQSRGFYLSTDGALLANEGQLSIKADDGVISTLWFGEVVPEGEDPAGGGRVGGTEPASAADSGGSGGVPTEAGQARFVMVTTGFDPSLVREVPKPQALIDWEAQVRADRAAERPEGAPTPAPAEEAPLPEPEDPGIKSLKEQYENRVRERERKLAEGRERAEKLSARFADWYYVLESDVVARLRPRPEELVTQDASKAVSVAPAAPVDDPAPPLLPRELRPFPEFGESR